MASPDQDLNSFIVLSVLHLQNEELRKAGDLQHDRYEYDCEGELLPILVYVIRIEYISHPVEEVEEAQAAVHAELPVLVAEVVQVVVDVLVLPDVRIQMLLEKPPGAAILAGVRQ